MSEFTAKLKDVYGDPKLSVYRVAGHNANGRVFTRNSDDFIRFNLRYSHVCYAKRIFIELIVSNNDLVDTATLINAPFLFDKTNLQCNGGAGTSLTIYPEEQWFYHLALLDQDEIDKRSRLQGITPDNWYTEQHTTIPAGGQVKIYIELNCILNQCRIPLLAHVSNYWSVNSYLTSDPLTTNSAMKTVSNLSIDFAQLYILGEKISSELKQHLIDRMSSCCHCYSNYTAFLTQIPLRSIANGICISSTLNPPDGEYSSLVTFVRARGALQEERYQFNYSTSSVPSMYTQDNTSIDDSSKSHWNDEIFDEIMRFDDDFNPMFTRTFRVYPYHNIITILNSSGKCTSTLQRNMSLSSGRLRWQSTFNLTSGADCELVVMGMKRVDVIINPDKSVQIRFPGRGRRTHF